MKLLPLLCLALLLPASVHATTRNSANNLYTITADTVDLGGDADDQSRQHAHVHERRRRGRPLAAFPAFPRGGSPADTDRAGYTGQLTEVVSLSASSASSSIAQNTSTQLAATATLDDGATSALLGTDLSKNPVAYPFLAINTLGQLFAAANVYAAPVGTVTISYLGASASVSVQVLGPYANGGIPDAWLLQYFGAPPNANAAPGADADGTGQTNLFKYLAGLNPLDGSRFVLTIANVPRPARREDLDVHAPVQRAHLHAASTARR